MYIVMPVTVLPVISCLTCTTQGENIFLFRVFSGYIGDRSVQATMLVVDDVPGGDRKKPEGGRRGGSGWGEGRHVLVAMA